MNAPAKYAFCTWKLNTVCFICILCVFVMCIFVLIFLNKDKDSHLGPLWPKYPPFIFIFCYLDRICLYNREISLAVLLRPTWQKNLIKSWNWYLPQKIVILYFCRIAHPYFALLSGSGQQYYPPRQDLMIQKQWNSLGAIKETSNRNHYE